MKVSIVTLHASVNYGSVLQTYATLKVFERLGHEAEFLDYCRANGTEEARFRKTYSAKSVQLADKVSLGLLRPLLKKIVLKRVRSRALPMERFLKDHIPLTKERFFSFEQICEDAPEADVYVTGSDQVWNSIWNDGTDKVYYLEYAPEGKRRIAYAASIGRTDLPAEEKAEMAELLKKYHRISMREQSGVDVLKEMGIDSELVLDPTLMLSADDWKEIAVLPKEKKPYFLVYQLNPDPRLDRYAKILGARTGLKVVKISKNRTLLRSRPGERIVCAPSVEELIGWFLNADGVLTDSFHGTAFSLNLSKRFFSVLPKRFGTRIESILDLTGTEDRLLSDPEAIENWERPIDWKEVGTILDSGREKAYRFLREALSE